MNSIRLLAGKRARQVILERGLHADLFTQLLAASGGPKWLGIAGLDKYLFSEFLPQSSRPLYTLGASSGAWRLACLAQPDPLAAYQRLEQAYIAQRYDSRPDRGEVERQVQGIIRHILGELGGAEILAHPRVHSHFIACRARHLNRLLFKPVLAAGLGVAAFTNLLSRQTLGWHFERLVFGTARVGSPFAALLDLPGDYIALNDANLAAVLQASGSIPLLLPPVSNITGAVPGHYYDGGITDYHFDLDLSQAPGLTLYPHFYPYMAPGWFDKGLKYRRASHLSGNYDNALILAPSDEFIASLPYGKIPDRDDFKTLDTRSRQAYWRRSAQMSERLAEDFHELLSTGCYRGRLE
ncbi:MAG: patatin-like phospholipase family protein [Shewanella sp.]|nr:patatin-like phospholipase family protein [Shewanella sp.]MCF1430570.1 patatin-like phospholipase family protein [Shewanella sp.]MCF1438816.1 patatin-like phospholipase family protein [Shewanella sp.]MCF1458469.1 patatin-like phospholipase family protein [Shewanella sp.]